MLARIVGLVAISLLSLASPIRAATADLDALLAELATEKFHGMDRGPDAERDPGQIVLSSARSGLDAEATTQRLVASLLIPPDGATSLLRAVVRDALARARRMSRARQIPTEADLRSMEADYRKARDSAPENVEILRSLFFFYRTWGRSGFLSDYPERLVADVRRMADPGPPAMELLVENPGDELTRDLLTVIPERYRNHPAVLSVPLPRFLYSSAGPPLAARALESASKISPPPDRRVFIHLAELQLRALIDKGLTSEAITTFERLAPEVANGVLEGAPESFRVRVGKLPYRGYRLDLRLDLAAAYVLEGRGEPAERILRLTERGGGQVRREKQNTSQRALLRALTAPPSAEDPFDRLADALGNEAVHPTVWALVFARYAERGGYRDAAADKLQEAREHLTSLGNAKMPDFITLPVQVSAEASKLRDRGQVLQERLGRQIESIRKTSERRRESDDMASTVARLLDAPRTPRYTERPLPTDVPPIETSRDDEFAQTMQTRKEILVPGDFALSRVDRSGDEILAIGIPWGQNWTAEAGSGGYWLIRSRDGGGNWSKPLYTGLRRGCPY
ncbi:MAG TPA: hypothetical protein VFF17_08765, partial [Thermoanaerobaculia bacterium]|nr:hypothetical protein [Thermoanaerobaculia bacterium]